MQGLRGYTLIEILFAMVILVVGFGVAIPLAHTQIDRSRTIGAASYMAARLATARFEAIKRSRFVAIQFAAMPEGIVMTPFVDGNGNGVLARDISRGIDTPIGPSERLENHFPGVEFGIDDGVTNPDPGEPFNVADPIQIGNTSLMSFNPNGSATAGTLFIRGRERNQVAVRTLGVTGRVRTLWFNFADQKWYAR